MWIEPERFYSVKETGDKLGIGRDAVVSLIKKGKLPAVMYPRMRGKGANVKRMVLGADIIRFIEKHRGGNMAA